MTSLQLFPPVSHTRQDPKEWGTGKHKEHLDLWVPRTPTWQYSGKPKEQFYTLTQLKLSNLRKDDQLVPRPEDSEMGKDLINKPFPAEHPYNSHISQFAVFPKFDSPEDPKRGVVARGQQPISNEMPASAYDIKIVHKTKGFGDRHEIQSLPKTSEKKALYWHGDDFFDQQVKTHGGRPAYYPVPPKAIHPNLQDRHEEMKISDRTANTLRNVERSQWKTSHELDYTGLGPSNPLKLDNMDDKRFSFTQTGLEDDNLYSRSTNTFHPPRAMEGRIARMLTTKPGNQKLLESGTSTNPSYKRKMTLTELEEHRLLNGRQYVNLPDNLDPSADTRWKEMNESSHPEPNLDTLNEAKENGTAEEAPYHPCGAPPPAEEGYLQTSKDKRDEEIQEIEAQNRWKVLESHKPNHDVTSLNYKYQHVTDKDKPPTFYRHEGKYNEERAGLYKTSYDPQRLAYSMNSQEISGPEIMNTRDSHINALNLPTRLSDDMRETLRFSRTLSSSQPNLSGDRRDTNEVISPYYVNVQGQKWMLQPTAQSARPRMQENEFLLKESTMGDSYNVHKFLQDNELSKYARNEPLQLMSQENQKLSNVRERSSLKSSKSVQFSDQVTVADLSPNRPVRVRTAPLKPLTDDEKREQLILDGANTTQYTSNQAEYSKANEFVPNQILKPQVSVPVLSKSEEMASSAQKMEVPTRTYPRRPATVNYIEASEYRDEFGSLSTNFMPTNVMNGATLRTSYGSQFPSYNLDFKNDPRFIWEPGHGIPRPQTSLLQMQDSFSNSEARRRFHEGFVENAPDLRSNIRKGKKHVFYGINCQTIHG